MLNSQQDEVPFVNIESNLLKESSILQSPTDQEIESKTQKFALADVSISLEDIDLDIEPEKILLEEDNGLKVTLCFTKNRPSKDTSVLIISISNKSKFPISEVHLDGSVKKVK